MSRAKRTEYLARVAAMFERYRIRGVVASAAHRRATLKRLHEKGLWLTRMRRCLRE
jgi:hypothetical protein